jgi:hypothetical protein
VPSDYQSSPDWPGKAALPNFNHIIFSRTDLALAIAPTRINDGRLADSENRCLLRYCAVGVEVAITPALDGEVVATFGLATIITVRVLVAVLPQVSVAT